MSLNKGFTLIETMIVIAIIGIMAAVITPNFIVWRNNRIFQQATRQVYSDIQKVRNLAIKNNQTITISITGGTGSSGSYTVFLDADNDCIKDSGETVYFSDSMPADITIGVASACIKFDFMGFARDGATSYANSITIGSKTGRSAIISVNITGNVRIS